MKQCGAHYPASSLSASLPVSVVCLAVRALMGGSSLPVVLSLAVMIAIIILGLKVISPLIGYGRPPGWVAASF